MSTSQENLEICSHSTPTLELSSPFGNPSYVLKIDSKPVLALRLEDGVSYEIQIERAHASNSEGSEMMLPVFVVRMLRDSRSLAVSESRSDSGSLNLSQEAITTLQLSIGVDSANEVASVIISPETTGPETCPICRGILKPPQLPCRVVTSSILSAFKSLQRKSAHVAEIRFPT